MVPAPKSVMMGDCFEAHNVDVFPLPRGSIGKNAENERGIIVLCVTGPYSSLYRAAITTIPPATKINLVLIRGLSFYADDLKHLKLTT